MSDGTRAMWLRRLVPYYLRSWWLPVAVFLLLLVLFVGSVKVFDTGAPLPRELLFLAMGAAAVGVLVASVANLIGKQWVKAAVNVTMLAVCGVAMMSAFAVLLFLAMPWASDDHFADDLTIPDGIAVREPDDEQKAAPGGPEDTFQSALLAALRTPGNGGPSVSARIPSLVQLHRSQPEVLRRYLATSPAWRLFEEFGDTFATRRWMVGNAWRYELHGYYTRSDIDMWGKSGLPDFQNRLTIGLSGQPWARVSGSSTSMLAGDTAPLTLSTGNQMLQSHCVIAGGGLVVEVFEQSAARERRLTKTALARLDAEMKPLADAPDWQTIRSLLPGGAIRVGAPSLGLVKSFQPGLYDSTIWVNPGEPGMVYLKAFEVTHETPLSADRLKRYSNEWIGWSDEPQEQFLSNTHFTIYEGDFGKPYAARFEVWFVPDSGAPERKLIEDTFKIEGWQR